MANGFAELKTELRGDINGLKKEVNGLKNRVEKMEEKIDNGVNKMLIIADGMTKQFLTWKQENAFGAVY